MQKNIQRNSNLNLNAMKYLSFKGIAVLTMAIIPVILKFKLRKKEKPEVNHPSILVEAV